MEPITTSEWLGMAIVAVSLLLLTAQTAYAFGKQVAQKRERLCANRRASGILASYTGRATGKSAKANRKPARKRIAGELVGGVA